MVQRSKLSASDAMLSLCRISTRSRSGRLLGKGSIKKYPCGSHVASQRFLIYGLKYQRGHRLNGLSVAVTLVLNAFLPASWVTLDAFGELHICS
jgi:hypothetical protein